MTPASPIQIAAFYKFTRLDNVAHRVQALRDQCASLGILGTILLATEGINATVSGAPEAIDTLLHALQSDPAIGPLDIKRSEAAAHPFRRLKVKPRREIITIGDANLDPCARTGEHVDPATWNTLLERGDVVLIDTRNRYETATGIFEGAIDPGLDVFSEFPDWVRENLKGQEDRPVAMYCTGGIRCEKAAAWMLQNGFKHVYQLHGGILKYIEETPPDQSKWRGECFVFDDRITVDEALNKGSYTSFGEDGKGPLKGGD